jgi:hypothetical protein
VGERICFVLHRSLASKLQKIGVGDKEKVAKVTEEKVEE